MGKTNGVYQLAAWAIVLGGICGGFIMACAQPKATPVQGEAWRGKYPLAVTAHRGFSGEYPENTLAAFRAAIAAKADMVELDVHLTRDKEIVVIHDDTLERTTDGKGDVADKTLAELKKLDAGFRFNPRFSGEPIPTLAEVLEVTRGRVLVNIELKKGKKAFPYTLEELADRTLAVVEKAGMTDQVLFSSFDPAAIDRIRERNPRLPVAAITQKPWLTPEEAGGGKRYPAINSSFRNLNEQNVRLARTAGLQVHAWTVNTPTDMEKVIALGVDGIITNYPDRLIELLKGKAGEVR
ncbi:MAG: glycerophosphodiester phosphodiesterase [Syntrophales bacterium]